MLEERFHVPCRLSNDANCAALAEQVAGAAVGHDNVVLITLGTGVGGGIIIGGKIYDGMRGAGAELGHTLLVLDGEPCTCGPPGLLGGVFLRHGPDPSGPAGGGGASGVPAGRGGGDHRKDRV